MEFSSEISSGLRRLANTSLVNDENFEKLLYSAAEYLQNPLNNQHTVGIASNTPRIDVLKESYASVITFLVESIRRNVEPELIRSILRGHRIQDDRTENILKLVALNKQGIQYALKRFNSDPAQVYDVSWKMNYCVKSSFSDFDGKCIYFIDLKIMESVEDEDTPQEKFVSFACTVQQLQSLVASLRAAVRQLENISNLVK